MLMVQLMTQAIEIRGGGLKLPSHEAFISNFRSNNPPKDGDQWKVNFSRVHWIQR